MPNVVGVKFKPVTKTYYFLPAADQSLRLQDPVIVETTRGEELGWISMEPRHVPDSEVKGTLKPILRKATSLDLMSLEKHRTQETRALKKCKEKVAELGLPMKVVQAEYSYDGSKLLFLFTSEQRVDFRELVRFLVRSFHTRVEMRQIGARDEAKIMDGYGRCGRQLCCSSWLTEFHPVSIRMAKNQQLPLAPTEISGVCGRLLCCLAYEDNTYTEIRKTLPKVGSRVETPQGFGKIKGLNILKESAIVQLEDENRVELPVEQLIITNASPAKETSKKAARAKPYASRGKRSKKKKRTTLK